MRIYLFQYKTEHVTGTASLQAEDDQKAFMLFGQCVDEPVEILTMTAVYEDGEKTCRDVVLYPQALGGGPVDLTSMLPDPLHYQADVAEGKSIMEELGNVPGELR